MRAEPAVTPRPLGDAAPAAQLRALQRQFLAALARPLTGASRARTALPPDDEVTSGVSAIARPSARAGRARTGLPIDDEVASAFAAVARALVTPSATLAAPARLELYHRQYWFRLLDALADDFPAVAWLLGPTAFAALCERYLRARPPATHTLADLGAGLARFVAATPAATSSPHHVTELAALEYAWCHAFTAGAGAAVAPAALATTPLALAPHLTLIAARTSVDRLWLRARAGAAPGRPGAVAASPRRFVAVFRDGLARDVERLHPAAHALLASIAATGALPAALEAAAPRLPARRGAAMVGAWFQTWTARGWLVARAA
ncbi:MAG: putative DNA-binding domain-containing protein [Myxococcales bacterium]|nr:putative DNA-binding domain-containing protein [Myxococcales bacterium]